VNGKSPESGEKHKRKQPKGVPQCAFAMKGNEAMHPLWFSCGNFSQRLRGVPGIGKGPKEYPFRDHSGGLFFGHDGSLFAYKKGSVTE
jgi:hypothetical protein